MKKVGIYSGVFDPVHHGHISFARKAAHELGLDKVFFLAEPKPRRKSNPSDIRHRLNMLWLALKDVPELELLPLDHHQFTVHDTLPWLEEKFANSELHLLMGTDLFSHLHTWPGFEALKDRVNFVVGQRAGESSKDITMIPHHPLEAGLSEVSSTQARNLGVAELPSLVPEPVAHYISAQKLYR